MDRFIAEQNIAHFEDLLRADIAADKRATLLKLLLLEEEKLGQYSEEHVAQIDRHILRIAETIARQRDLIVKLNGNGRAANSAEELLGTLVQTQALYEQRRTTILKELR